MTSRSLPALAAHLSKCDSIGDALEAIVEEVGDADRSAAVALFRHDPRRDLLVERLTWLDRSASSHEMAVSFDHFPAHIRKRIGEGNGFAEFADQSGDFMKLLGMPHQDGAVLLARGLLLDNELCGILMISEPKRRFGQRVSDKVAPSLNLFVLAFSRILEHDARVEAARALEEITGAIHSGYGKTVDDLEGRLRDAHKTNLLTHPEENGRIAELEQSLAAALKEARFMAKQLAAVEDQVQAAVAKLEHAHLELHEQTELTRRQTGTLHDIQLGLEGARSADDPVAVLEALLALLRKTE